MKQKIAALSMVGAIAGIVTTLGAPSVAQADIVDDAASACGGRLVGNDWRVGADCKGMLDAWKDTISLVLSAGASWVEECMMEGCSNEEVREMKRMYTEEMINESGASYHEMMEIANGAWQNWLNSQEEAVAVLGLLGEFEKRGWSVRIKDIQDAQDRAGTFR